MAFKEQREYSDRLYNLVKNEDWQEVVNRIGVDGLAGILNLGKIDFSHNLRLMCFMHKYCYEYHDKKFIAYDLRRNPKALNFDAKTPKESFRLTA